MTPEQQARAAEYAKTYFNTLPQAAARVEVFFVFFGGGAWLIMKDIAPLDFFIGNQGFYAWDLKISMFA